MFSFAVPAGVVKISPLPATLDAFLALRQQLAVTEQGGAAVFIAALLVHARNPELGRQCLTIALDRKLLVQASDSWYKGFKPSAAVMYHLDALRRMPFLPGIYIQGTTPAGGYALPGGELLVRWKGWPRNVPERPQKVFLFSTGGNMPRPLSLQKNNRGSGKCLNSPASLSAPPGCRRKGSGRRSVDRHLYCPGLECRGYFCRLLLDDGRSGMRAIILAAGIGKRLQEEGKKQPKCFLKVGEKRLVERYVDTLTACGVSDITFVLGYMAEEVQTYLERAYPGLGIDYIVNEEYLKGNILSAYAAAGCFDEPFVLMDADVAFPDTLLRKLLDSPRANCLLLDTDFNNVAEEMKRGADADGRVWEINRHLTQDYPVQGEGVGFFKCSPAAGAVFRDLLKRRVENHEDTLEYETVLFDLMQEVPIGYELVAGLPWTEIDFPEDLQRAREIFG